MGRPISRQQHLCRNCGKPFPNSCIIDGKHRGMYTRHYCLDCHPWGTQRTDRYLVPPRVVLEGLLIGDWTILHESPHEKGVPRSYLCRCKCGFERVFPVSYLNTGILTCCEQCRDKQRTLDDDLFVQETLGKKRGLYTIVAYLGKNQWGSRLWLCRCKCGTETVYTTGQIFNQGPLRARCENCWYEDIEMAGRTTEIIPARFWERFCGQAKRRGIPVDLTKEIAYGEYVKQGKCCALSGVPLYFSTLTTRYNWYTNASIDRVDSEKNYSQENIQWVHKDINMMKGMLSQEDFLNWCRLITNKNPQA